MVSDGKGKKMTENRAETGRMWILPKAGDPEMVAIEALLRECGETVVYAADARGERVTAGTAYRGESLVTDVGNHPCTSGVTDVYLVECELLTPDVSFEPGEDICHPELAGRTVRRIDHHRPGDPGYGRPPSEFLAASSIGQVVAELARLGRLPGSWDQEGGPDGLDLGEFFFAPDGDPGAAPDWFVVSAVNDDGADGGGEPDFDSTDLARIPRDLVLIAAADHCLGAAYAGDCPGVDPDALMAWRAESRAKFQGRDVSDVLADVERAQAALRAAPLMYLEPPYDIDRFGQPSDWSGYPPVGSEGGVEVRDMRQPVPIRELPEAAVRLGIGYVSGPLVGPDGRQKITCSGSASQIRAFLDHWVPAQGLVDAYGDPARGFAGAYLPKADES